MSDDGFHVDLKGIDGYATKLSGDTALANEVSGLVAQSDVGDQSWGIVGLFVKSKYTEMLGDLDDLLGDMRDGLQSGAEKMTACAQTYRDIDTALAEIFNDVLKGGK